MDDNSENFMEASVVPASCLHKGYCSIALFNEHHAHIGEYQSACLLIKAVKHLKNVCQKFMWYQNDGPMAGERRSARGKAGQDTPGRGGQRG